MRPLPRALALPALLFLGRLGRAPVSPLPPLHYAVATVRFEPAVNATPTKSLICALADIPDPGTYEFAIGGGEWPVRGFLVRYQGQVCAYLNRCPHAGHLLNWGTNSFFSPDHSVLICSSHGALFVPNTGQCVAGPCIGQKLRSIDIVIEHGQVLLNCATPNVFEPYWVR
jgi:nitrite reductase/ring-hydroxylating ferredoxin subunit